MSDVSNLMAGLLVVVTIALILGASHWNMGEKTRTEAMAGAAMFSLMLILAVAGAAALFGLVHWLFY